MKTIKTGQFTVIEPDVQIGENVEIGHHVTLKSGTRIGDNVKLADYVKTTGLCRIGNNVNIRTGSCVSKGVLIEDWAFIGPDVMTNHMKYVQWGREFGEVVRPIQQTSIIGYGVIIGSKTHINAGVKIHPEIIVGAHSTVTKTLTKPGLYFGSPACFIRPILDRHVLKRPVEFETMKFSYEELKQYLPGWAGFQLV